MISLVSCLEVAREARALAFSELPGGTRWAGEALSIALDPSGQALLTLPHANKLLLWRYRSSLQGAPAASTVSAVSIVSMPEPRGVYWEAGAQRYIVSSATERALKFVGQGGDLRERIGRGGSGSHIAALDLSKMP